MAELTSQKIELDHPTKLAAKWLVESGVQVGSNEKELCGGVRAWWNLMTGEHSFVYSEITGYAVNAYLYLHAITGESTYLECARKAADWILGSEVNDSGLLATRYGASQEFKPYYVENIFVFDQWMVIYGMCNAFTMFRKKSYLEKAIRMANFLLDHTTTEDGGFYPMVNVETGEPDEKNDKWSRESGSFLAKALLGLNALDDLVEGDRYAQAASALAQSALRHRDDEGRFITQTSDKSMHFHPYLYTLEGLLAYGMKTDDSQMIEAVERAFGWIMRVQQEFRAVYTFSREDDFLPFERVDALAQTLRLGAILMQRSNGKNQYHELLAQAVERLQSYQIRSGAQTGGFFYGQEESGAIHYHVNTWVTMFAAQALWLYDDTQTKAAKYNFNFFV